MISRPTTPQLIEAVCVELTARVAPETTNDSTKVLLDMMVTVLRGAAVRSANELAWMREEADAIEVVIRNLLAESVGGGQPSTGPVARLRGALQAYVEARSDSRYLADALTEYERASEALSCAAEAANASSDARHKEAVSRLLDQRMANEIAVTGQFAPVGRG